MEYYSKNKAPATLLNVFAPKVYEYEIRSCSHKKSSQRATAAPILAYHLPDLQSRKEYITNLPSKIHAEISH